MHGGNKNNTIRVLHLITQAEFGGAQKYVLELAIHIGDSYQTSVAAGELKKSKELLIRLKHKGIETHNLKHVCRSISPIKDVLGLIELTKLILKLKPDIIHLHASKMSVLGSFAACLAKRFSKDNYKPIVIYTAHGWVFTEKISRLRATFYEWAERYTAPLKDKIIVLSELDKKLAIDRKIAPASRLKVIPNGVRIATKDLLDKKQARHIIRMQAARLLRDYNKQSPNLSRNPDELWVGTIANLYKNKGLEFLIEAAGMVNDSLKETGFDLPVTTFIIGEGQLQEELHEQIEHHSLQNQIFLTGRLKDAWKYLKAFDIFVLPSLKEGFPFVLLEAMTAQVPVIATQVGAIPEVIEDKKNGILVPPGNSSILAENILELIHHEGVRVEIGKRAKAQVSRKYTLKALIRSVEKVYSSLVP